MFALRKCTLTKFGIYAGCYKKPWTNSKMTKVRQIGILCVFPFTIYQRKNVFSSYIKKREGPKFYLDLVDRVYQKTKNQQQKKKK